jgi:hypothetical protein
LRLDFHPFRASRSEIHELKGSIQNFPNRYLRRFDKHLGAILPEGLNVRRFGMLIQSLHARPIFVGEEMS